jgi:HPt (histidine-containing phosphotransfer) domain-containing protein
MPRFQQRTRQVVPPTTAEEATLIFDREGVLGRLEGDNELAQIVFAAFVEDIPSQIRALKDLVKSGDAPGAARQAHSIRGAAANVGGERLRALASEMETAADANRAHLLSAYALFTLFSPLREFQPKKTTALHSGKAARKEKDSWHSSRRLPYRQPQSLKESSRL